MKKFLIAVIIIFLQFLLLLWLYYANRCLEAEKNVYLSDLNVLQENIRHYYTKDSLHVAQIGVLTLRQQELEKWRKADADVIKSLQTKNRKLKNYANVQTKSHNVIKAEIRDSIVYIDHYARDTLRCINVATQWLDIQGCERDGVFEGTITNKDKLMICVTAKYKRFLGFLWKTNKIKDRKVDVISKNPNTEITDVEYIEIR